MVADIIFVVVVGGVKPVDNPRTRRNTRVCAREKLGITLPRFQQHRAKTRFSLSIFPPVPFDSFFFPFALFENLRAFSPFLPQIFQFSAALHAPQPVSTSLWKTQNPQIFQHVDSSVKKADSTELCTGARWGRGRFSERRASPPDPLSRRAAGVWRVRCCWLGRLQVGCGFLHIARVHGG